jgi:DNA-binding NarL/FixJ family response regulator
VIRIVVADDHTLVRAGLRVLLESIPDVEVVAEANDGREALQFVKELCPDMVLLDVAMPRMSGLETLQHLKRECPTVRVLMLSVYTDEEYVYQALRLGAAGYLLKDAGLTEVELAIRAVERGAIHLSPAFSQRVVKNYLQHANCPLPQALEKMASPLDQLTLRQREILHLIAAGYTTKEMASRLQVHVKTAEVHRAQLMVHLNIRNTAGLVRYAIQHGFVVAEG